ncbi:MAG: phospholipid carrier-dependent glycosyltransferase, partial [Armatimonadota bacterium]
MIAPSKFAKIFLLVFACAHLVFAGIFAYKTPYRTPGMLIGQGGKPSPASDIGAPDERQHANYIRFLLKQHSLPVLVPGAPNVGEEYESHQPPLYYALSAIPAVITGKTDVETPAFGQGVRDFNCLIGAIGIVGVFFAVFWATKREDIALVGTAFAALLPMNCALSGTISNDPLLIAMISWSFAFCARALGAENDKDVAKPFLFAAIFAGLACLTKSTGLVSIAGLAFTGLYLRSRLPLAKIAGLGLVAILIASPIWIRNHLLYGDPLAQKVFKQAFTGSPKKEFITGMIEMSTAPGSTESQYWINWVGYWTARSYIGAFGYVDIWLNASGKASTSANHPDPNWLYKAILVFIAVAKIAFWVDVRNRYKDISKAIWVGLVISILTLLL